LKNSAKETLKSSLDRASGIGHRGGQTTDFDERLTDYSRRQPRRLLGRRENFLAPEELHYFHKLTGPNQSMSGFCEEHRRATCFGWIRCQAYWNPLTYNQSLANGLYRWVARALPIRPEKRVSTLQNDGGDAPVMAQAKRILQIHPRLPETAIEQPRRGVNLVRKGLKPLRSAPQ